MSRFLKILLLIGAIATCLGVSFSAYAENSCERALNNDGVQVANNARADEELKILMPLLNGSAVQVNIAIDHILNEVNRRVTKVGDSAAAKIAAYNSQVQSGDLSDLLMSFTQKLQLLDSSLSEKINALFGRQKKEAALEQRIKSLVTEVVGQSEEMDRIIVEVQAQISELRQRQLLAETWENDIAAEAEYLQVLLRKMNLYIEENPDSYLSRHMPEHILPRFLGQTSDTLRGVGAVARAAKSDLAKRIELKNQILQDAHALRSLLQTHVTLKGRSRIQELLAQELIAREKLKEDQRNAAEKHAAYLKATAKQATKKQAELAEAQEKQRLAKVAAVRAQNLAYEKETEDRRIAQEEAETKKLKDAAAVEEAKRLKLEQLMKAGIRGDLKLGDKVRWADQQLRNNVLAGQPVVVAIFEDGNYGVEFTNGTVAKYSRADIAKSEIGLTFNGFKVGDIVVSAGAQKWLLAGFFDNGDFVVRLLPAKNPFDIVESATFIRVPPKDWAVYKSPELSPIKPASAIPPEPVRPWPVMIAP